MGSKLARLPQFLDHRDQYGAWWDFTAKAPTQLLPLAAVTAGANANDDVSATLVGVIPRASRLIGGYIAVSANSTGVASGSGNASLWEVAVAGTTAISKTVAAAMVANTGYALDTPAVTDLAAGGAVTLAITNGANADLNTAVCYVGLELADVNNYPAPGLKVIATNGGTVAISDGVKGVVTFTTGATNNDEIYMCTSTETIKFASGKYIVAEVYLNFTEVATDDANIIFGMMNAVAADCLIDDGGGPKATGDYVAIWKTDGQTHWYCGTQSNGTQLPTSDTLLSDASGHAGHSSAYRKLKIEVDCISSTEALAKFSIDDVEVQSTRFTYASATEMQLMVGAKAGGAATETLNVDYLGWEQVR